MRIHHSFFISDFEFCKSPEKLIKYLAEKINIGLLCIYCENKGTKDFKSPEAVRNHMTDKGHCFMNTEHFDEYAKFYDFSAQYKDLEVIKGKIRPEDKKEGEEFIEIAEGNEDWEDVESEEEDWEDDEGETDEAQKNDEAGQDEVKKDKEYFKAEREKKKGRKYVYLRVKKAKLLETGEIELPTGKILGNRIYRHVYKQYYRNRASTNERIKMILGHNVSQTQLSLYHRNNQLVLSSRGEEWKARRRLNRLEDAQTRRAKAAHLDLGMKANKLQPFFRQQCPL